MVRSFISSSELLPFCRITRQEGIAASITLCLLLLGLWLPHHITLSTSPSLDHRIFFLLQLTESDQIRTGDFIVFSHPDTQHIHQGLSTEDKLLIKMVGCAPGKKITTQAGAIYCEDTFLGNSLISDGEGKILPQFTYNGLVPANKYFMIGGHESSFDSRYFGFIDADDFRFKAWPLW